MNNLLLDYITTHINWEQEIINMGIDVKHDGDYALFKYNMLKGCDFHNDLCKVCRGIIVNLKTMKIVCRPFDKFFNYGEEFADNLDWNSVKIREKIDGSLMKVWWDCGNWHISTNGTIDADKAELQSDLGDFRTYGELFKSVFPVNLYNKLDKRYTYMFELVSPYSTIVVHYDNTAIYHLATRDNETGKEVEMDIGIQKPKDYTANTIDELINAAAALPDDAEGYVAYDKDYKRIKVKNPTYVMLHHIAGNRNFTTKRFVELIKEHEDAEFLNYFPEFTDKFNDIKNKIAAIANRSRELYNEAISAGLDKRGFAIEYNNKISAVLFTFVIWCYLDNSRDIYNEIIERCTIDKILELLELEWNM